MSDIMREHHKRYMDYSNNTTSALAHKYTHTEALSKKAYDAGTELRNIYTDTPDNIKAIADHMSNVGDELANFADELKTELRHHYEDAYGLRKAIEDEIVDSHELHHSDQFEAWIEKHLIK